MKKNFLLKNMREKLYNASSLLDNFEQFCKFSGTISITGPPGTGKLDMIFRFLNYCTFRDRIIVALRDQIRIEEMIKSLKLNIDILMVNPVYTERRLDIKNIDQVTKLANRMANDILKAVRNRKDPVIIIHRSNDLSLDRVNEISNVIKENFWSSFIDFLSPEKNGFLLIFNCDEFDNECINLLTFSHYLIKFVFENNEKKIYINKLRL